MEKLSAIIIMGSAAALSGAVVGAMAGGSILSVQMGSVAAFILNAGLAWTAETRRRAWARSMIVIGALGLLGMILVGVLPLIAWIGVAFDVFDPGAAGVWLLWGPLNLADVLEIPQSWSTPVQALDDSRMLFIGTLFAAASTFLGISLTVAGWFTQRRVKDEESAKGWDLSPYMVYHTPSTLDPDGDLTD